jgi:hypothetical protein
LRYEKQAEKQVNAEQLKEYAKANKLVIDNQEDKIFLLDEEGNLVKIVEKLDDDYFLINGLRNKL